MLTWIKDNPPVLRNSSFEADYRNLVCKIEELSNLQVIDYQRADISDGLFDRVKEAFRGLARRELFNPVVHESAPFVVSRSPAMAMFGGMDVDISESDVTVLRDILVSAADGETGHLLQELIENAPFVGKPWQDGYQLAEDLLDDLEDSNFDVLSSGHVSTSGICRDLRIEVIELELETDSVRGVAVAGVGLKPTIVVNENSVYNGNENSRRFTVAHELCHILHDQSRARKLAHISGPWASPAVEQRANAFAAWLLMPRPLLKALIVEGEEFGDIERVRRFANRICVTDNALIWHLYNLDFIHDSQRESFLSDIGYGRDSAHVT